jgi:malate synthase
VLFVVGQANRQQAAELLEAIFDYPRDEVLKLVQSGKLSQAALAAHDYVFDIFPETAGKVGQGNAAD